MSVMNNSFQYNWNKHWILGQKCPNSSNCTNPCLTEGFIAAGILSDFASIVSAFLIIVSYNAFRDLRTKARRFLFHLSIADLFNATWFLFAHVWSLFRIDYSTCYELKPTLELSFCILQATMNVYFTLVSFYWTIVLAVYILCLLFEKELFVSKKSRFLLELIGWGVPVLVAVFGLLTNIFGPGRGTGSAGWCFISYYSMELNLTVSHAITEFLGGKLFDILTLMVLVVLYAIAFVKYVRERRKRDTRMVTEQELKLALIPIAYILLRAWGTFRCFMELTEAIRQQKRNCHYVLIYMQAIGDPGQGWVNGILFLLLTKELRKRTYRKFMQLKEHVSKKDYYLIPNSKLGANYSSLQRDDIFTPKVPEVAQ